MKNNIQYIQEDKMDLRELFFVLKKRKKLIWVVTALFTLFALGYVLISKPVYEINAMIEIGQIDEKPIDNVNDIKEKLSFKYQVNTNKNKKEIELPRVKAISIPNMSTNILSLTIHANSNEEGMKYIQTVINQIETEYKEKINTYENNQKELIELTQKDIKENTINYFQIEKELNEYSQKIISLKSQDAALAGIYVLQIGQINNQLQELKKYISELKTKEQELKLSITPLMMKPTHIAGQVETYDKPIKPKKLLIIIIAFITGLMISVFLAFFLEFIKGSKEEKTEV